MKKILLLLLFTTVCFNLKANHNYYWAGTTSTSYSTMANWRIGSYSGSTISTLPTNNDTVRIGNLTNNATIVLDIDTTISVLIIEGSGQIFINTSSSKTLSVTGNIIITNTGTTGGGSATIKICGSGNQTLSNNSTIGNKGKLPNITINKSGGTLFFVGYITMGGSTTLKYLAGAIDAGTSTVSFYLNNTITGVINVYNAEFQGTSSTCTITDTLYVNDSLNFNGSSGIILNGKYIKVKGNVTNNNSYPVILVFPSATIEFIGSNRQILASSVPEGEGYFPNIKISKTGDSLKLVGKISIVGDWTNNYSTSYIAYGTAELFWLLRGTLGGSYPTPVYDLTFHGGTFTLGRDSAFVIKDSLKISGSGGDNIVSHSLLIEGSVINSNPNSFGTSIFIIGGGNSQMIRSLVSENTGFFSNILIQKSAGTVTLKGIINVWGSWTNNYDTVHINCDTSEVFCNTGNGTFTFAGTKPCMFYNLVFGGSSNSNYTLSNDTIVIVKHTFSLKGAHNLVINSHSLLARGDIQISSTGGGGGTGKIIIGGSANQTINSTVTEGQSYLPSVVIQKNAGTLTMKGTISAGGNWTNNYDTVHINCDTSEVFIGHCCSDGTQTIGGTVPCMFYNLAFGGGSNTTYAMSRDTAAIVKHSWKIKGGGQRAIESGHSMIVRGDIINTNQGNGDGGTTVVILNGSANQTISSTATRGNGQLPTISIQKNGGTVSFNGSVITFNGDWINNYSTAQINYGTSELYFYRSSTQNLGGTFKTPVYRLTLGGSSGGTNTYNIGIDSAFIVNDTFKLIGTSFLTLSGHSLDVEGHIVMNATTSILTAGSIINLGGGNNQVLTGTNNLIIQKLAMNKTTGTFTLNKPLTITTNLNLTTGNIVSSSTNIITLNNGATVSNASDNSFVSGPVKKVGNAAFTFPTGKGSYYNSIEITAPSSTTDAFTAEYFNTDTLPTSANRDTSLTYDSQCEFWHLYRTTGTSNVKVKLYWNTHTCDIYTTSTLKVAYLNSGIGKWQAIASKALGTITSGKDSTLSAVSSFGDFTIGKKSPPVFAHAGRDTSLCYRDSITIGASPTATGGLTPYSYSWSPVGGLSTTTGAQPAASPTTTTSYVLTVTDLDHSTSKDTMVLTLNANPFAHAGADTGICYGTSGLIGRTATGGSSPYTYSWSPSTGLNSLTVSRPTANPTVTSTYVVTITDHNTCTAKDTILVTVNPIPTAHAGNDTTICYGLSTLIGSSPAATGGTSPYTYQWFPSITLSNPAIAQPAATPTGLTNDYTLMVKDANQCKGQQQVKVTVIPFNFCYPCGLSVH